MNLEIACNIGGSSQSGLLFGEDLFATAQDLKWSSRARKESDVLAFRESGHFIQRSNARKNLQSSRRELLGKETRDRGRRY